MVIAHSRLWKKPYRSLARAKCSFGCGLQEYAEPTFISFQELIRRRLLPWYPAMSLQEKSTKLEKVWIQPYGAPGSGQIPTKVVESAAIVVPGSGSSVSVVPVSLVSISTVVGKSLLWCPGKIRTIYPMG
jgi:hypothetical protein